MSTEDRLHLFCGKMAAGKSTMSKVVVDEIAGIRFSEDELLSGLYPGKVVDIPTYVQYSNLIKKTLRSLIVDLLRRDISVVLDFPANTQEQRQWFLDIAKEADVSCILYVLSCSDDICLSRLAIRAQVNPERAATDTAEMFHAMSAYYQEPSSGEGFNIVDRAT